VDIETRRKKQQDLMLRLVERKVRSRAKQLYEKRGQGDGQALQDWFQAESEVVGNGILAPLYRRRRTNSENSEHAWPARDLAPHDTTSSMNIATNVSPELPTHPGRAVRDPA
jgi:hypothetical protein